jgi:hypothetical protein
MTPLVMRMPKLLQKASLSKKGDAQGMHLFLFDSYLQVLLFIYSGG